MIAVGISGHNAELSALNKKRSQKRRGEKRVEEEERGRTDKIN